MKYRLGYIGGTFDLTHWGHARVFQSVGRRCDSIVVSLNTDEFVEQYKGQPPIMTLAERVKMIVALGHDVVINTGGADSRPAILASGADSIWHDDTWMGAALMRQMGFDEAWLREHGLVMGYFKRTEGISTSDIISRVNAATHLRVRKGLEKYHESK